MSEERKEDIKNDLEKDSIPKATTTTENLSNDDSSTTSRDDSSVDTTTYNTNTDTIKDENQEQEQEHEQEQNNIQEDKIDEKLLSELDSEFKKTNENLISLEKQELSSLKMPKQSFYKKRAIFLKDNTEKINNNFKYLVYLNKRKTQTKY